MMIAPNIDADDSTPVPAPASAAPLLQARGVTHFYGAYQVLDGVDLSLHE